MQKIFALLFLFLIVLFNSNLEKNQNIEKLYQQWKNQYGIDIPKSEDIYRKFIFMKNLELIRKHNEKNDATYKLGINHFAHLSSQEFQSLYTNKFQYQYKTPSIQIQSQKNNNDNLGDIDWESLGKVSPVGSQGQCDAGYAFCTASLFESFLLMTKDFVALSEQQLVDCGENYTMMGCNGGSRLGAIQYINEKGIDSRQDYPWVGRKNDCKKSAGQKKFSLAMTQFNGCDELQKGLVTSPITIAVNTQNWQFYRSGIFNDCGESVNHDIYLIGFTKDNWRLKNSWSNRWGQFGFIRLATGNTCGICTRTGYGFKLN